MSYCLDINKLNEDITLEHCDGNLYVFWEISETKQYVKMDWKWQNNAALIIIPTKWAPRPPPNKWQKWQWGIHCHQHYLWLYVSTRICKAGRLLRVQPKAAAALGKSRWIYVFTTPGTIKDLLGTQKPKQYVFHYEDLSPWHNNWVLTLHSTFFSEMKMLWLLAGPVLTT